MISPETISVLLVEDDEDDSVITIDMLARHERARFHVDWCSNYRAAIEAISEGHHDVYLIDYRLGELTGLDLVREAFASRPSAPVVILTGQSDYEADLEASSMGITDFLLKAELNPYSLERSIRYAMRHHQVIQDLSRSEKRYALAAAAVNDGIWDWNLETGHVYYSPRWRALVGHPEESEETPDTWFDKVHADDLPGLRLAIEAHLSGRTSVLQFKHRLLHSDGTLRWMLARGMAVRAESGEPTHVAGSLSDITTARRNEHQLQHAALHDPLTGLPNRALFLDRVERAILRCNRDPNLSCAVLFVDIDRFKLVNDSFSHHIGDRLLIALASRVAQELGPSDTVARIAGDEFTILLEDLTMAEAKLSALAVAERVRDALSEVFSVEGQRLFVTASTGISVAETSASAEDLIRNADIAMYEAKNRGRDRVAVFDDSMHRRVAERLALHNQLREAIVSRAMRVYYQPVVNLASGNVIGLEALVRWPSEWSPTITPGEFIPIAEETGLVAPLGLFVLETALRTLSSWRSAGLIADTVGMSVNVSPRQLEEPTFVDDVLGVLDATGVPGKALTLEMTEYTLMRDPERMSTVALELGRNGVGLDLDDFGTGYSSLTVLNSLPFDTLKIDRSFVADLTVGGETESDMIVRSTIALGHSLGLEVIAEGIENDAQVEHLRCLGCDHGQGYFFSAPLPAADATDLLGRWAP